MSEEENTALLVPPPQDESAAVWRLSQDEATPPMPSSNRARKAKWQETILFFMSAVGCTLGWTAVLSNLVFYTDTLGVNSYLYLNVCIYTPMLPITIAQTLWDADFDRHFTSLSSFWVRGTIGFAMTLACTALVVPLASVRRSLWAVSIGSLFLGAASGALHGALKQMAAFVYPGCGRLAASVTAGLQASAVLVLLASLSADGLAAGLVRDNRDRTTVCLWLFYGIASLLVIVCWICFQRLMTHSQDVYNSMMRRDSSMNDSEIFLQERVTDPFIRHGSVEEPGELEEPLLSRTMSEAVEEVSTVDLLRQSWPLCLAIFLTVASSMAVASWFNRVPSTSKHLPQVLFYTRLFADLLSRPATLWLPSTAPAVTSRSDDDDEDPADRQSSLPSLLLLAFARLAFVPYFFLYTTAAAHWIPRSDIAISIGVFFFAFTSGFVTTWVYQLAPQYCQQGNALLLLRQTNVLNVCFSASIVMGVMVSLTLSRLA